MADMPTIIETGKNDNNGWGGNAWALGLARDGRLNDAVMALR